MKREVLKDFLEVIGIIAIVASLIFLAVETRQNTDALSAEIRQAVLTGSLQELVVAFDNPDLTLSISKSEPLTPQEQIRLDIFYIIMLRAREFAWLQYQDGIIDDAQWRTEVAVIDVIFDASKARKWWNALGRSYFGEEFVQFVDAKIDRSAATDTLWQGSANWAN